MSAQPKAPENQDPAAKAEGKDSAAAVKKFGTFKGVFTPSVLTVLGVIMFLRMGWVLGQLGLLGTIVVVCLSSAITFLTALSIAATATNMHVGGGGAYYMLSRSLGVEAGAAVGIPLYFAQTFGIAFYLAGFAESVSGIIPSLPPMLVASLGLGLLSIVAYTSADIALKTQFVILGLIVAALISFFLGEAPEPWPELESAAKHIPKESFWTVFAVFFPAVTGIEAGLAMSGDLRAPQRSLPWGTLAAVLIGLAVYLAIPLTLSQGATQADLLADPLLMQRWARYGSLVMLGLWGASLSSALGALLGAPRTLQALSRDRVVPRFFAGSSEDGNPRLASIVTFIIAAAAILLGDLNSIAPVLSMFFLTSYGMLNLSAALEGLIANPSWRPNFRTPWQLSAAGGLACIAVMFMIDAGATIASLCVTLAVYYIMQKRKLTAHWGDMRRGILMYLSKFSIERLARLPANAKSWRPNVLVFSGAPTKRWYLIEFASALTQHAGFLTVATVLARSESAEKKLASSEQRLAEFLSKRKIPAFARMVASDSTGEGMVALVRGYGLGPISANTVVVGDCSSATRLQSYVRMLIRINRDKRNIVIIKMPEGCKDGDTKLSEMGRGSRLQDMAGAEHQERRIAVWWGRQRSNAALSLALGYLLQQDDAWKRHDLCLKSVTTDAEEMDSGKEQLESLIKDSRLKCDFEMHHHQGERSEIFECIRGESQNAGFVFLGMQPPDLEAYAKNPEAAVKSYSQYYQRLMDQTTGFPPLAFVLAAEELDFHRIFR